MSSTVEAEVMEQVTRDALLPPNRVKRSFVTRPHIDLEEIPEKSAVDGSKTNPADLWLLKPYIPEDLVEEIDIYSQGVEEQLPLETSPESIVKELELLAIYDDCFSALRGAFDFEPTFAWSEDSSVIKLLKRVYNAEARPEEIQEIAIAEELSIENEGMYLSIAIRTRDDAKLQLEIHGDNPKEASFAFENGQTFSQWDGCENVPVIVESVRTLLALAEKNPQSKDRRNRYKDTLEILDLLLQK